MALTTNASITFETATKRRAKLHVPTAKSLADLRTFAYAYAAYTTAKIIEISFSQAEDITDLPGASGDVQALNTKVILIFHGQPGKTRMKKLGIPAPKIDVLENIRGAGLLVKKDQGRALAEAYSALTGETFTFIRGRLSGKGKP